MKEGDAWGFEEIAVESLKPCIKMHSNRFVLRFVGIFDILKKAHLMLRSLEAIGRATTLAISSELISDLHTTPMNLPGSNHASLERAMNLEAEKAEQSPLPLNKHFSTSTVKENYSA